MSDSTETVTPAGTSTASAAGSTTPAVEPVVPVAPAPRPTTREDHGDAVPSPVAPHTEGSNLMQLREVLHTIRRNWLVIVATLVTALVVGAVVTVVTPNSYETATMVLVSPAAPAPAATGGAPGATTSTSSNDAVQAASLIADQVATYAALAVTPAVLGPAVQASGVDVDPVDLGEDVTAEVLPQTSIIELTVDADTAANAAALAEAISGSLIAQLEAGSSVQVTGSVVAAPEVPDHRSSPNLVLNLLIALAVGLVVAFLVVVVRRALAAGPQQR